MRAPCLLALLALLQLAAAFRPATLGFAVFGNSEAKALVKSWAPKPEAPEQLIAEDAMARFVRARILLEEPNTGCVAAFNDEGGYNIIVAEFNNENKLLAPLWHPSCKSHDKLLKELHTWHTERLGHKKLTCDFENEDDKQAWTKAFSP